MKIQFIKKTNKYCYYPPPWLINPPGIATREFQPIIKKYKFVPLRAAGARQPDVEGRLAMRIAAMDDGRYCCGDVVGR
jgi:hypothetical protein